MDSEVPEAICELGYVYQFGWHGVVRSGKKAEKLYKRAVELGNVDAMWFLGYLYADTAPTGIKLDRKKAARLYRMAADRGHAAAQFYLAMSLLNGAGVSQDPNEARLWFERAAAQGFDAEYYARDGHGQWQYHGLRHGGDDFDSDSDSGSDSDSSG